MSKKSNRKIKRVTMKEVYYCISCKGRWYENECNFFSTGVHPETSVLPRYAARCPRCEKPMYEYEYEYVEY